MADDLLGGALGNVDFGGAFTGITTAVMYIIIFLALAGVVWFIVYWLSFKIKVRVREIVRGRTVINEDKARRFKDRDGVYWWKLRKLRIKMPEPPSECIDITSKGKKVIEFFRGDDGSFVPIEAKFNYETWKDDQLASKSSDAFKPFSTNQRISYIHELRQSETYRKKKLGEVLLGLAPFIAIVLILVIFMIFFNETVKPTQELGDKLVVVSDKLSQATDYMGQACLGKVKLQLDNYNGSLVAEPPN